MILGFKDRFEPMVCDDGPEAKSHTIRAMRAGDRQIRVGDFLDFYVKVRQKGQRPIGWAVCTRIEKIRIVDESNPARGRLVGDFLKVKIVVDGAELSLDEKNALAWRDGFRTYSRAHAFAEMVDFWRAEHGKRGGLDFAGVILHWRERHEGRRTKRKR